MPTEVTQPLHFRTLLNGHTHLIADFYATWCPPCKTIAPVYQQLSAAHASADFAFVKINVDEARELAAQYGIQAMPTFLLFREGKQVEVVQGADVRGLKKLVEGVGSLPKQKVEKVEKPAEKVEKPNAGDGLSMLERLMQKK